MNLISNYCAYKSNADNTSGYEVRIKVDRWSDQKSRKIFYPLEIRKHVS